MDKPYTTYEEQLDILKRKKLTITDDTEAIELLKECSYFALISGYKAPFKGSDGNYKIHTTLNDIHALYEYDMELRELFLRYILKIENHIKSLISYSFCATFGELQSDYLNVNNYDSTTENQDEINKLISKFQETISVSTNHVYLQHQLSKHGNIPLWALIRAITIGTISKMYSYLKPNSKYQVSIEFAHVTEGELEKMLNLLSRFRNVCAHNERLYDYVYRKGNIKNTQAHRLLQLKQKKGVYVQGKKDLFAVVIVFKYLLNKDDFDNFIEKMSLLTESFLGKTSIIQRLQLLKMMGFPENWKDIRDIDLSL